MANEKRLIDANALRKRMFSYYSCVDENSSKEYYRGETLMSYEVADMIEDCIDNAPTVDAVEVVHGRWILKSRIYKMFDDVDEEFYVECNLCNREEPVCFEFGEQRMLEYAKQHYPYCHCGAKMDGERKDND